MTFGNCFDKAPPYIIAIDRVFESTAGFEIGAIQQESLMKFIPFIAITLGSLWVVSVLADYGPCERSTPTRPEDTTLVVIGNETWSVTTVVYRWYNDRCLGVNEEECGTINNSQEIRYYKTTETMAWDTQSGIIVSEPALKVNDVQWGRAFCCS